MKRLITIGLIAAAVQAAGTTEAASMKDKYVANCVKFSKRVNRQMRADDKRQKQACDCICEKVQSLGADDQALKTIMEYTREYDFTVIPKQPTFQQILQAHVDVHRDIIKTQADLEEFVKGMMSCSFEAD